MGQKGGSDLTNRVGEFEASTALSQSQELFSVTKAFQKECSSALSETGKAIANGLSNVVK
jgi:hypothetical protein